MAKIDAEEWRHVCDLEIKGRSKWAWKGTNWGWASVTQDAPLRMLEQGLNCELYTETGEEREHDRKIEQKVWLCYKSNFGETSDVGAIVNPAVWHVMMSVKALLLLLGLLLRPQKPFTKAASHFLVSTEDDSAARGQSTSSLKVWDVTRPTYKVGPKKREKSGPYMFCGTVSTPVMSVLQPMGGQ